MKKHLAAPDLLRVGGILTVAWYHFWQQSWLDPGFHVGPVHVDVQQAIRHGYMAVDLIVLLSGFLLALGAARGAMEGLPRERARTFWKRRYWRIMPSYLLAVVSVVLLYGVPSGAYWTRRAMWKDLLTHLTLTHTFSFDTYVGTTAPVVLWTVAIEAQFYLLWPAIEGAYRRQPGTVCWVMASFAWVFRTWCGKAFPDTTMYVNQLPAMLDLYACGLAAAWVYARLEHDGRPSQAVRRWVAPVGMLACAAGVAWVLYRQPVADREILRQGQMTWRPALGLLGGGFLLCGCLATEGQEKVLGNPAVRFLAAVSYNFYIWHQFLAVRLKAWHIPAYMSPMPNQAYEQPWQTRYTWACFLAALLLAAALTYLWEKPLYKLGNKLGKYENIR